MQHSAIDAYNDADELQRAFDPVFSLFPRLGYRVNQRGETPSGGEQRPRGATRVAARAGGVFYRANAVSRESDHWAWSGRSSKVPSLRGPQGRGNLALEWHRDRFVAALLAMTERAARHQRLVRQRPSALHQMPRTRRKRTLCTYSW